MSAHRFSERLRPQSTTLIRRAGKRGLTAVTLALAFSGLVGCSSDSDPHPLETFSDDLLAARVKTDFLLPAALPPELTLAWVGGGDGIPAVSFYSENQPVVTVCTGSRAACTRHATDVVFRTARVDGQHVVISLGRREEPAPTPSLDRELASFWSAVELNAEIPDWLNALRPADR